MPRPFGFFLTFLIGIYCLVPAVAAQELEKDRLQLAENPPMRTIYRDPPPLPKVTDDFEIRKGFTLIDSLDAFREAIKKNRQKIRMKPGIYRAKKTDPPVDGHQHIFAVTGSGNYFDLRGAVFETPVSLQSTLSRKPHVSDSWHIFGNNNTFEGGYFRNVIDMPYPKYGVNDIEFEVRGDRNTFRNGTFVIRGSVPYGYSDFYGKGGPNFGRLNKHSFMLIQGARKTKILGCQVYVQSFGHCLFFSNANDVLVKDCYFTGTLRPTNDIFKETVGRASEYDFKIMYRGERPIPRDDMIPLTEDGVRSYDNVKNIRVVDTTVERLRSCFQLLCVGDVTLDNVTALEAGNYSFDISSGDLGKVVLKNCRSDVAYSPVFNLSRGDEPVDSYYDVTILSPDESVRHTSRSSLGTICGERCTFIIRDGTTRPLPEEVNHLQLGGYLNKKLTNSKVTNYTTAKLIVTPRVSNCLIKSVGPVEDQGKDNKIVAIRK